MAAADKTKEVLAGQTGKPGPGTALTIGPSSVPMISNYAIMNHDITELKQAVMENLAGVQMTPWTLDRVKIPAGGATTWEVPSLDGISETKEISGVLIGQRSQRSFWRVSFDESGGGSPPDCASTDGVRGSGQPGGDCLACPLAAFGSGKGASQACRAIKVLFMIRPDDFMPLVIAIPPGSLKPMNAYLLRLASKGVAMTSCVTKLALTKTKSQAGIAYAQVTPSFGGRLSQDEIAKIKAYSEAMAPLILQTPVLDQASYQDSVQDPPNGTGPDPFAN